MRIDTGITRGPLIEIAVEGRPFAAHEGEMLAAALWAGGLRDLRSSPAGGARGMFCAMGVCQECTVMVGGRAVSACRTPVTRGMQVSLRRLTDGH